MSSILAVEQLPRRIQTTFGGNARSTSNNRNQHPSSPPYECQDFGWASGGITLTYFDCRPTARCALTHGPYFQGSNGGAFSSPHSTRRAIESSRWLNPDSAVGFTVLFEQGVRLQERGHRTLAFHRLFLGRLPICCSQVPNTPHRTATRTPLRGRGLWPSLREARTLLHASTSNWGVRVERLTNQVLVMPRADRSLQRASFEIRSVPPEFHAQHACLAETGPGISRSNFEGFQSFLGEEFGEFEGLFDQPLLE